MISSARRSSATYGKENKLKGKVIKKKKANQDDCLIKTTKRIKQSFGKENASNLVMWQKGRLKGTNQEEEEEGED